MKKLTIALALILCLVLCVFSFASCGKKKTTATTAEAGTTPAGTTAQQGTTPAGTTAAATTAPATQPPHVHTPEDHYTVDVKPTCLTDGEESLYCVECGAKIPDSTRPIPADPDAHVVDEWTTVEPTLFDPVGSKSGTCVVCEQPINVVLNWELDPFSSVDRTGKWADQNDFRMHMSIETIRGDKSFAPTEDDSDGNDLWFEYSILWNETLYNRDSPKNLAEIRMFGFRESTNWSSYRGFYYLYLRDDNDGFHTSSDCPWRGHIDYSTYDTTASPPENCAYDLSALGNTLNGRLIGRYKAGWDPKRTESPYLWDSEWQTMGGWHRLGFRYHQEAAIVEGAVVYTGYTELYIDGVLCWKIDSNFKPGHKDSLVTKNLLLWTAEIDPEDNTKLIYTNHDSMMVEMRLDSVGNSSKEVLIAVDDVRWTCGDGFAVPVVRVENPKPVKIELKEGLYDDGAMYFAKPGCVHEAEAEWTVLDRGSLLADGTHAKYCAKCGERMEIEACAYEPDVQVVESTSKAYYGLGKADIANEVLAGDKRFYPTESDPEGNDLYIEFSILWSTAMTEKIDGYMVSGVCSEFETSVKTSWMALSDGCDDCWCPYAGGYEACDLARIDDGPATMGAAPTESVTFADYPNISGAAADSIEWGWHRIMIRIRQTVTNEDALKADETAGATPAEYKLTGTYYVDGVKLIELSYNGTGKSSDNGVKWWGENMSKGLFSAASDGQGGINYSERSSELPYAGVWFNAKAKAADDPGYVVFGDVSFTCGKAPVQNVDKVAAPAAATYEIATGVTVPAAMYYQAKTE